MKPCNIILIEDNKKHREKLSIDLSKRGYKVNAFHDIKSLKEADKNGSILNNFDLEILPTLIIFDIMLAYEFDINMDEAPRWDEKNCVMQSYQKPLYVDNRLGLKIAGDIRDPYVHEANKFKNIKPNTPILFFTGLHNEDIVEEIREMENTAYIEKPAFLSKIEEAIEKLLKQVEETKKKKK